MHYLLNTYEIQVILTLSFAGVISSGSLNFNALEMVINNASTTNNFSIFLKTLNLSETIDLFSQGNAWVWWTVLKKTTRPRPYLVLSCDSIASLYLVFLTILICMAS